MYRVRESTVMVRRDWHAGGRDSIPATAGEGRHANVGKVHAVLALGSGSRLSLTHCLPWRRRRLRHQRSSAEQGKGRS